MSILEVITEQNPAGESYKNEDAYIEIEVEIEKSFNVTSESKIDWDFVIKRSEVILSEHSKDLKLVSYWMYAQWQLNGWSAFLEAFDTYAKFVERYHTALHPNAARRKIKPFEWVESIIEKSLLKAIEQFSEAQLNHLVEILAILEISIPIAIETEYKFLKDVNEKCQAHVKRLAFQDEEQERQLVLDIEANAARKEADDKIQAQSNQRRSEEEEILAKFAATSSHSRVLSSESISRLSHEDIEEVKEPTLQLCRVLFEKSASDYFAFKMLFSLGEILLEESQIDTGVDSDEFIPSQDIASAVRNLLDAEVSLSQLIALEEQLLLRPTWIEGYYIATKLLFKLGQIEDAQRLELLLLSFLQRVPSLMEKSVKNGKLIPEKMQLWVEKKILELSDDGGTEVVYQQAYQEVSAMRKEQSNQNALSLLEEYYYKAKGDEERFRWRLLFVEFAFDTGDKKLALALLLALEQQIEEYQVDKWQPELAIRTYETLLKPILTQELGTESKERIYKKLSILDIQKVINL